MARKFLAVFGTAAVALGQTVTIANGIVQGGTCPQADINFFLSIPYAEPPVGERRFAAPRAYNRSFNGTYNATNEAPDCPQFGTVFVDTGLSSEDCLFVDVYAPATAKKGDNLPVKVWLYGGVDQAGGISGYSGCMSATDSILVSINYRLGPLGFLTLEAAGLTGNFAIQDQLLGLQWVQENIHAFGGDKDQVLLFGQSAGAFDAFAITTLPQAKSLMKAAALESGAGIDFPTVAEAKTFHELFVTSLNCSVSDAECLRSKTVTELQNTFLALPISGTPLLSSLLANMGAGGVPWGPVIDGTIIPAQPSSVGIRVPSIVGTAASEGTLFVLFQYLAGIVSLNETEYDSMLTYNFGPLAADVNATYPLSDFDATALPAFYAIANVITDYGFRCPAYRALRGAAANGVPVYAYSFDHTPSCPWTAQLPAALLPVVGPTHTAELPFVFGLVDAAVGNCTFTPAEQQLGDFMRAAWTSMAATGAPGGGWPAFAADSSQGVIFDDSALAGTVDYSVCAFWDEIGARVSQLDAAGTRGHAR